MCVWHCDRQGLTLRTCMKGHARTGQFWSKEQLNHVLEPSSKEAVSVGPRMQFDLARGVNASPGSRVRSWRRIWEGRGLVSEQRSRAWRSCQLGSKSLGSKGLECVIGGGPDPAEEQKIVVHWPEADWREGQSATPQIHWHSVLRPSPKSQMHPSHDYTQSALHFA